MNVRYRFVLVSILLLVVFAAGNQTALAQDESVVAPEVLAAMRSFDQKYYDANYIAYSGMEWVAQRAHAIYFAEDFDSKFFVAGSIYQPLFQPGYFAHSGADMIAPEVLIGPTLEDFDNKFMTPGSIVHPIGPVAADALAVQIAQEEVDKAQNYGLYGPATMDLADHPCWDWKFFLPGHVVCPEGPVASEPAVSGS